MSLFPAYGSGQFVGVSAELVPPDSDATECNTDSNDGSAEQETRLLASDSEDDCKQAQPPPAKRPAPASDFYIDTQADRANLRVSTLYYPGRPDYIVKAKVTIESGSNLYIPSNKRRYYEGKTEVHELKSDECSERLAAFRRMLADAPGDEDLWMRYVDFQEWAIGAEAAMIAAEEGATRVSLPSVRSRLLMRSLNLARRALSAHHYQEKLQTMLPIERNPTERVGLWARAIHCTSEGGAGATRIAAAALADLRYRSGAYPAILYAYGAFLREAGLFEQLVLLTELVTAMNCSALSQHCQWPPLKPTYVEEDKTLQQYEDKAIESSLPLHAVWSRIERARAQHHWRPANESSETDMGDPQRAPHPADLADLLLPVSEMSNKFMLTVHLLRLAKVPILPWSGYTWHAMGSPWESSWECHGGEALLPLIRASRHLAGFTRFTSSPRKALALLVDPPHYLCSEGGYLGWVESLFCAAAEWAENEARLAMLLWRLRLMHTLLLLTDDKSKESLAERKRIRNEARTQLRSHADDAPVAFAQFARIERAIAGKDAAERVMRHAMHAALRRQDVPKHHALYIARVWCEVSGGTSSGDFTTTEQWALVCAVLRQAIPDDTSRPPSKDILQRALEECEERCNEIEVRAPSFEDEDTDEVQSERAIKAMLPDPYGEWASARAMLAPPQRAVRLCDELLHRLKCEPGWRRWRYGEHSACALSLRARSRGPQYARAYAHHYPHNALLALMSASAPIWSRSSNETGEAAASVGCGGLASHVRVLATLYTPLLRAVALDTNDLRHTQEWEAVSRTCARVCSGFGYDAALAWSLRVEAEARSAPNRLRATLLHALLAHANHKWLHVRGGTWCASELETVTDLLLERQLRAHALPHELEPLHIKPAEEPPANNE